MNPLKTPSEIIGHASGFRPPQAGEGGLYVCNDCENRFCDMGNGLFWGVMRNPFMRCPKCGSVNTQQDTMVAH